MPEEILFEEVMRDIAGFLTNRERGTRFSDARIMEANDLIYNSVYRGQRVNTHTREYLLREALTTADFPYLFGDVLDRQMLAAYKAVAPVWKPFVKMSTVRDFRTTRRIQMTGGDDALARVAEKGEYLTSDRTEVPYYFNVNKYGRQFDISWESMINDDLGALKDTPERFAMAAVRTEHRIVTSMYARSALYSIARGNAMAGLLTIDNLETAVAAMQAFTDGTEIILNRPKYLVVRPADEFTARQILTSANKMWLDYTTRAAGPINYAMPTTNVIAQYGLDLIVDPYLSIYGGADLATQWYLFADPKDIVALEFAHLQGHERPEICMKASDKVTIGGGPINPMTGDFATDNIFYRVRHVFGGVTLDWRGTYMGGSTLA